MIKGLRHLHALAALFVGAALAGALTTPALAAPETGPVYSPHTNYGPILGYSYYNYAGAENPGAIYGLVIVHTTSGEGNAPTSYMGAQAGLYYYTGSSNPPLCAYTTWLYNAEPATNWENNTTGDGACRGGGDYFGKGNTAAYNGSGYSQAATLDSPNLYGA